MDPSVELAFGHIRVAITRSDPSSSSCATCTCSFLGFERHSRAQCPILLQHRHSLSVGLFDDSLHEESSHARPRLRSRSLPVSSPLASLPEWFSASHFFLCVSHSSVTYNFLSCCNNVGASSNASSTSFNRPVRSTT
jgi:hypothetical protein